MDHMFKNIGTAMQDYAITSARKVVDLNTELFKGWVELNKSIMEMTPAKDWLARAGVAASKKQ